MDHVFVSRYLHPIENIIPNSNEVNVIKAFSLKELKKAINENTKIFSPWFVNIFNEKADYLIEILSKSEDISFNKKHFEDVVKIRNDYNI